MKTPPPNTLSLLHTLMNITRYACRSSNPNLSRAAEYLLFRLKVEKRLIRAARTRAAESKGMVVAQ